MLGNLLEEAGIRKVEFAEIARVDRRTVHNWITGMQPKNPIIKDVFEDLTAKIRVAVEQGQLPLKDLTGRERLRAIKLIINK